MTTSLPAKKPVTRRLISSLMGAVGLSLLSVGSAMALPPTYDGLCALVDTTVTCTGVQAADGVEIGDVAVTLLEINSLTSGIAPPVGTPGIVFDTSGEATANITLDANQVFATGENADGIYISAYGTSTNAALTLTGNVESEGGRGIVVTGSGIVSSDTTGTVTALQDALTVRSWGGAVEVDHSGDLTSHEGSGLHVEGMGIDIDVDGNIVALGDGVNTHAWGDGATKLVVAGNVTSYEGSGVVVDENTSTAEVTITGDIAAYVDALAVEAVDDITIDATGALTADSGVGITAISGMGGVSITHDGGTIHAHTDGILAEAHGAADADVIIGNTGSITADEGRGVVATAANGSVRLNLDGATTAKDDAIRAEAGGEGVYGVDIASNGNVVSYEGQGIYASTNTLGGITGDDKTFGIRIDQTGDVTARLDAVTAAASQGNVYVDIDGNVVSDAGRGVSASTTNGLVDVVVGDVTAKLDAITLDTPSGAVTLDAGDVVSYDGNGIEATTTNGSVTITAGDVTAKLDAIQATTPSGAVTIKTSDVTSYDGKGIVASTKNGGMVDIDVGDVTSQQDSIYAYSISGTSKVTAGDVTSYSGKGVVAMTDAGGNAQVTVGDVTTELDAIYANSVSGSVTVKTGTVLSNKGAGIVAAADYSGGVQISAGTALDRKDLTAELDAIVATSRGTLSVIAGDVVSSKGQGVFGSASAGTVTFNLGDVTAEKDAVHAETNGSYAVNVTAGDVLSYGGAGVFGTATESSVTFVLGDVAANGDAIYADAGNGTAGITAGNVTSDLGAGVFARSKRGTVNVSVANVTSESDAIYAEAGSGNAAANVEAGDVLSREGKGVFAKAISGAVDVTVGDVTSKGDAIHAEADAGNSGVGVTAGDVLSEEGDGIFARAASGSVDVLVGDVTAAGDAVYAESFTGLTSVQAGDIVSGAGRGVFAITGDGGVEVSVGSVTSELDAIYAESTGASSTGPVVVEALGPVVSGSGKGISAYSTNGAVTVTVDSQSDSIASDVTAKLEAITAEAKDGNVDVSVVGDVTSYDSKAIQATALNGAATVTIGTIGKVADVTGKLDAVTVQSMNGDVAATVAGNVVSYDGKGISATTLSGAATVTVGGNVTSKLDAVTATTASGTATVDVGGNVVSYDGKAVVATSDTGPVTVGVDGSTTSKLDAILAQSRSGSPGDLVTVDVGSVTSYDGKAIQALASNGGVIVTVGGNIESKGDAITARSTGNGIASTVGITTNGTVVSNGGRGILAEASDRGVTIESTGSVTTELGGIVASSTGSGLLALVDVTQTGKLTSYKGIGIAATSSGGPVIVTTSGGIEAELDGIVARSYGDDAIATVGITNTAGSIVSYKGSGMVASSTREGVTVDNTGNITAELNGIWAASTGNSPTSQVVVNQTGDIAVAKGSGILIDALADAEATLDGNITGGAYGIHATSLAGGVEATIVTGASISSASGAAVYLNAETTATLVNRGALAAGDGLAFEVDGWGAGTVDNYGTISGNFAFDLAQGTFNNKAGATYEAGTAMSFLAGGTLNNMGTFAMTKGGANSMLGQSYLTGDFVQGDTGRFYTDIRFSDSGSDRLMVSGTAQLAGTVTVNVADIDAGIYKDFLIVSADQGLTLGSIGLSNPVLIGSVISQNDSDAILRIEDIDFAPAGIGEPVTAASNYMQDVFAVGPTEELKPLFAALMSTPDLETYEEALDQLTPEQYSQEVLNTYNYNLSFSNRMLSCRVADGPDKFKAEGECDWFDTRLSVLDQDETDDISAFEQTFATLEAGSQRRLDENWRMGAAVGLTSSTTSGADGSSSEATQGQAGVVVKYDAGSLLLASTLTAGYGVHESTRDVSIGAIDDTLTGDAAIGYVSTRLHAAYTFDMGAAYIKPLFNLDLTATRFGGVTETGGATALTIEGGNQYAATFNPAIEIGGEFKDSSGKLIRPFAQVGVEAAITSELELAARFSNVDPSIGSFTVNQPGAEPVARLSLGADILTQDKATIRVYYDGSFGASSRKNGIGMKLSSTID